MFLLLLFCILSSFLVQGKLDFGSTWNRRYPDNYNGTVVDYIKSLAIKTGEFGSANGLNIRPLDYSFPISQELLGVSLKGDVQFYDGVITSKGKIVPSVYAPESNRSSDLSKAFILFAVRLDQLDVTYKLKTKLEENNVDGSVEVNMKNVDFFYLMTHIFANKSFRLDPKSIDFFDDVVWKIIPRTVATYGIETVAKRSNDTDEWYKESLIAWHRDQLRPMLVQQAQDLPFPISQN